MKKLLLSLGALSAVVAPVAAVVACGSTDSKGPVVPTETSESKAANIAKIKAKLGDDFKNAPAEQKQLLNSKLDAATDARVAQLERDLASSDGEQEIGDVINGFMGIDSGDIDETSNPSGQGDSDQLGTIVENGGAATAVTSHSLEDLLKTKGYTMSGDDDTYLIFDQLLAHTTEGVNVNFHLGKTTSGKASISNKHVENHEKGGILRHNGNDFLIIVNGGTQVDTTQALITSNKLAELSSTDVKFIEQWGDLGDDAFADATSIIYLHNDDNGGIKVTVNQVFKFNGKVYEATQDGKGVKTLQAKYVAPTA